MLDKRRPYGGVCGPGAEGAVYYQDGHYFDHHGKYLRSNPGIAPPAGQKSQAVPAPASRQVAATVTREANTPPSTTTLPETLTREQKLQQMSYFQLASLVKAAGGEPDKGSGAKQKMIAFLLENTTE